MMVGQQGEQWWMNSYKDLLDSGRFNDLDPVHCFNLLAFNFYIEHYFTNLNQTWYTVTIWEGLQTY